MPHQQVEFLQLVQCLATHCALLIPAYHTVFVGVDHGAADRDVKAAHANEPNELVGEEGTRHLQTQEPSRATAFAFAVIVPPLSAAAIAPRNTDLFQVLDHQLAKLVVPRDGIVYCHHDE